MSAGAQITDGGVRPRESRATVLVVDDLAEAVDLFGELLDDRHEVLKAHSGEEALDRLTEEVDVVLLDRKMPGLSGYEVVEAIRERRSDVCIAMVSASEPDFDVVDVDFDDYLTKPVGVREVNATVERLLGRLEYDERRRECAAVAAKLAALEENKAPSALRTSDEYAALERRLRELENGSRTGA